MKYFENIFPLFSDASDNILQYNQTIVEVIYPVGDDVLIDET